MQVSVSEKKTDLQMHLKRKHQTSESEQFCQNQSLKKSARSGDADTDHDVYVEAVRGQTHTSQASELLQRSLGQYILSNEPSKVQGCLSSGARLDLPVHTSGSLALGLALLRPQNFAVVETLVRFDPACVNLETEDSLAPLLLASMHYDASVTRFLLEWGADPFRPGADERPSTFDQLSYSEALPRHRQRILDILQDWRRSHPETFQTSLRLGDNGS